MKRANSIVALALLLCATIQGCGPQEDFNDAPDSEVRGDTEPSHGTSDNADASEDGAVTAFSEVLLAEYESDSYVEGFVLNYLSFSCPSCTSTIRVEHWTRACRLCSYRKYADYPLQPGQSVSSCNDGRRTKVRVYGSYSERTFYNWSFNFVNCS